MNKIFRLKNKSPVISLGTVADVISLLKYGNLDDGFGIAILDGKVNFYFAKKPAPGNIKINYSFSVKEEKKE